MKLKLMSIFMISAIAIFLFTGCTSKTKDTSGQDSTTGATVTAQDNNTKTSLPSTGTSDQKTFTAEVLSKYDGQNGNPAYVAVHGNVYDVTNVPQWSGGKHNGLTAGKDLTKEFDTNSPHKLSQLDEVPVVGKYIGK